MNGDAGNVDDTSYVYVTDASVPVPVLLSNFIVYVLAFHWAYNVISPDVASFFTDALLRYYIPEPSCFVFHSVNV